MATAPTSIELFTGGDDTLDARMRAVAQGTVLGDVIKDLTAEARTALEDAIAAVSAQTGTAFTARKDGVTALITDPQPRPTVTDEDAFKAYCVEQGVEHEIREFVEVLDHARAVATLHRVGKGDIADAIVDLFDALEVRTEIVLPAKALDTLVADAHHQITPDGLLNTGTGELVPGVDCFTTKPTLQVRLDKKARQEAKRQVRDALGLPAELGEVAS